MTHQIAFHRNSWIFYQCNWVFHRLFRKLFSFIWSSLVGFFFHLNKLFVPFVLTTFPYFVFWPNRTNLFDFPAFGDYNGFKLPHIVICWFFFLFRFSFIFLLLYSCCCCSFCLWWTGTLPQLIACNFPYKLLFYFG